MSVRQAAQSAVFAMAESPRQARGEKGYQRRHVQLGTPASVSLVNNAQVEGIWRTTSAKSPLQGPSFQWFPITLRSISPGKCVRSLPL